MTKYLLVSFVLILLGTYLYFSNDVQLRKVYLNESQVTMIADKSNLHLNPINNSKPLQENIVEHKKPYLSTVAFDKIQSEVGNLFKQSDKELISIYQREDNISISFENKNIDAEDMNQFINKLNYYLYLNVGEYKAFLNKKSGEIQIKQLNDFLATLSDKINKESKNITNVSLVYETPLEYKPLDCVTGEDWKIQKNMHDKNNCNTKATDPSELLKIIKDFYKDGTDNNKMSRVQSVVFPIWDEIFENGSAELTPGYGFIYLCYPNRNTILMEIGCNFKLKIIQTGQRESLVDQRGSL